MGSTDFSATNHSVTRPSPVNAPGAEAEAAFAAKLDVIKARRQAHAEMEADEARAKRRFLWAHHWPEDYEQRCCRVGGRPVCRRCSALYPIGFAVAFAAALGAPLWPDRWDPVAIWLLCLPATLAFVGEMVGWFSYSARWQVGTTAVAGLAFGKALGYELLQRWSTEFWGPIAVFGGIWFFASWYGHRTKAKRVPATE